MPELPEVETVVRALRPAVVGARIESVLLRRKDLRFPFPKSFKKILEGQRIVSIDRRAKYILMTLSNDYIWVTHLGMTGMLAVRGIETKYATHDHAVIGLDHNIQMIYNDPRRFGYMDVMAKDELNTHKLFAHLGAEPLNKSFTADALMMFLARRSSPIKTTIMDQKIVVGVGNIYASESLHMAKIDPRRPAHSVTRTEAVNLVAAIKHTLKQAIKAGGSTIQNFATPDGGSGYFQHDFKVYDRAGLRCDCGKKHAVIEMVTQQGRSTYFCATCQR